MGESNTKTFTNELHEHNHTNHFTSQSISVVFDNDVLRLLLLCRCCFLSPICSGWQTCLAGGPLLNMYSKRGSCQGSELTQSLALLLPNKNSWQSHRVKFLGP